MEFNITTTKKDFVKEVNKIRLANKGKWIFIYADVDEHRVYIKNYDTYLQRYVVDGYHMHSGVMDMPVGRWKEELQDGIGDGLLRCKAYRENSVATVKQDAGQ